MRPVPNSPGALRAPSNQISDEKFPQHWKENTQRPLEDIPVLVSLTGSGGSVRYVHRHWEHTIDWNRIEPLSQDVDAFAACYPDAERGRQVFVFIATAHQEWHALRHLIQNGRELQASWIEMKLPEGMTIGIAVATLHNEQVHEDTRAALTGPSIDLARAHAYLRCLFMPPHPVNPEVVLRKVEPLGPDLRLHLTWRTEKRLAIIDLPAILVDLSVTHGSADLLVRMIHHRIQVTESR